MQGHTRVHLPVQVSCPLLTAHLHSMSDNIPIISQEDLGHLLLTKSGSGFSLRAQYLPRNISVSVKLLTIQWGTDRELRELLREVADVWSIQSSQLLPPVGVFRAPGLLGVVTEWMEAGSLQSLIHEHQLFPEVPFPLCARILADVAEGLDHLHNQSPPVLHQALKPSNVLLDARLRAKISDYGLAHWREENRRTALLNGNTWSTCDVVYLSPERLHGAEPTPNSDVYSFAVLCWETFSRQKPLEEKKTLLEAVTGISCGLRPEIEEEIIPRDIPRRPQLLQLLKRCWHQKPEHRPPAADCATLLEEILAALGPEKVASAVHRLMCTKERAAEDCKGPQTLTLQIDLHNLEVPYTKNHDSRVISKDLPLQIPSLSTKASPRLSTGNRKAREDSQEAPADHPRPPPVHPAHLICSGQQPAQHPPLSGHVMSNLRASGRSDGWHSWKQRQQAPKYSPSHHCPPSLRQTKRMGASHPENCCQVLEWRREAILRRMTEGWLNRVLDALRSRQALSRADYEAITSGPTVTARARVLLDTCLCLGEGASQVVVAVLLGGPGGPLAQDGCWPEGSTLTKWQRQ
ncbi:receptor-interacting serine/threonine-protein kinase 2-like isoform X2 [Tachyglossus aculeatus]|uniref:receptor-interacting serine/threonine-protein kinase 2-like isoform X2 n=1 Tax=Tachyglossus aculeatus TaxID=9261 RepID=UPI0018F6B5B4|nr:receptor-interacting serine/threonine-protein kinase 2-like isoform X2 [Tachyglossus aculeatus]